MSGEPKDGCMYKTRVVTKGGVMSVNHQQAPIELVGAIEHLLPTHLELIDCGSCPAQIELLIIRVPVSCAALAVCRNNELDHTSTY